MKSGRKCIYCPYIYPFNKITRLHWTENEEGKASFPVRRYTHFSYSSKENPFIGHLERNCFGNMCAFATINTRYFYKWPRKRNQTNWNKFNFRIWNKKEQKFEEMWEEDEIQLIRQLTNGTWNRRFSITGKTQCKILLQYNETNNPTAMPYAL